MNIKPEHYFWLRDGTAIKDLNNLAEAFQKMHDDIFKHHVDDQKNDFSNWIRDVLKDKELAIKIAKARSSKEMHNHIRRNLNKKNKKEEFKEKKKEITSIITEKKVFSKKLPKKHQKKEIKKSKNLKKKKPKPKKIIKVLNKTLNKTLDKNINSKRTTNINKFNYVKNKLIGGVNYLIKNKREFLLGFVFGIALGIIIARYVN